MLIISWTSLKAIEEKNVICKTNNILRTLVVVTVQENKETNMKKICVKIAV